MARTRLIHPGAPQEEDVANLSVHARLTWAYLPCHADREGRLKDSPFSLKLAILPSDSVDMDAILGELAKAGFISRYSVDGRKYVQIRSFSKYQKPHQNEAASEIPSEPKKEPSQPLERALLPLVEASQPLGGALGLDPDPVSDPVSDPISKTLAVRREDPPSQPKRASYPEVFEAIWRGASETKRLGNSLKAEALTAWVAVGKPEPIAVLEGWKRYLASLPEYQTSPKHLGRWLKARGWEQEYQKPGAAKPAIKPATLDMKVFSAHDFRRD